MHSVHWGVTPHTIRRVRFLQVPKFHYIITYKKPANYTMKKELRSSPEAGYAKNNQLFIVN